jgi:hypothetical protein
MKSHRKPVLRLTILGIFLCLLYSCLELAGPAWHLVYGDSVRFRGWKIPVPRMFCVIHSSSVPELWKLPIGIPRWHGPYAIISFIVLTAEPSDSLSPERYERWTKDAAEVTATRQKYWVTAERKVLVDGTFIYCFESVSAEDRTTRAITCPIKGSPLVAEYFGSLKYFPDFYSMLKGMSRARPEPK